MIRLLLRVLLFTSVWLGGCASVTELAGYPETWPPVAPMSTTEDCPNLAGSFENTPFATSAVESDRLTNSPTHLTGLFAHMAKSVRVPRVRKAWQVPSEARAITIEQSSTALTIKFMDGPGLESRISFRRTQHPLFETTLDDVFVCDALNGIPRLRFMLEVDMVAGGAAFIGGGRSRKQLSLYRTTDASLVAEWNEQSAGLVVLVPYIRERSDWRLYHSSATDKQ